MDREKIRHIQRLNQIKVIFINFCPLLSHLPMIPCYFPERKEKRKSKNTSAAFREKHLFCSLQNALTWQEQLSSLNKRDISTNYNTKLNSSPQVFIHYWTKQLSTELSFPWHWYQPRKAGWNDTFEIGDFFLLSTGTGFVSYTTL